MPFCPECRYEYKAGTKVCPDCGKELVNNLDEVDRETNKRDEERKWVPLASLTSEQYAEMLIEALREKKIPAVLESDAGFFGMTGQMGPSSFVPVGGAYVVHVDVNMVKEADEEGGVVFGEEWDSFRLIDIE